MYQARAAPYRVCVMKRLALGTAALVAGALLTGCGAAGGGTVVGESPEAPAKAAAPRVSAKPAAPATTDPASDVQQVVVTTGEQVPAYGTYTSDGQVALGNMTVTRDSATSAFVEVETASPVPVVFDGTFTGYDASGTPVATTSAFRLESAGYAGGPVSFAGPVAKVTYTANGVSISWTL